MIKKLLMVLSVALMFGACNNTKKTMMPPCSGKTHEICFIVPTATWNTSLGDTIKNYFSRDIDGLPQSEPQFTMFHIPKSSFTSQLKAHRNIIDIVISSRNKEPKLLIKRSHFAKDQLYLRIVAKDIKSFISFFNSQKELIARTINDAELMRTQKYFRKYPSPKVFNAFKKHFNLVLSVPVGYNLNKRTKNFLWTSCETQKSSEGIFMYRYKYTEDLLKKSNPFETKEVIKRLKKVMEVRIPGPSDGSFMTVEEKVPVVSKVFSLKGLYVVEHKGLWKVHKDFMGGPFVHYSIVNPEKDMVYCFFGYVYSPSTSKRDMIRKIEAIIKSVKFLDKNEIEKDKKVASEIHACPNASACSKSKKC
ncbi:DUF4837 family protein [Marinilabiliaceae bacterium JC040]|nr:DUF4837 family protein [Marinilabiliaceae bacterium JC040]